MCPRLPGASAVDIATLVAKASRCGSISTSLAQSQDPHGAWLGARAVSRMDERRLALVVFCRRPNAAVNGIMALSAEG